MSAEQRGLYRFGGLAWVASAVLFLARAVLDFAAGPPPADGVGILAWAAANTTILALANEALFFAALLLVPAVVALYLRLSSAPRSLVVTGCGLMAVTIPVLAVLDIVHGRLVYPMWGIAVQTPEVAGLVATVFYGGLHAVDLIWAVAAVVLSLAMRRAAFGPLVVVLGMVTGVLDVVAAYPHVIGPIPTLVCRVVTAGWFAAVGWRLRGVASPALPTPQ